MKISQIKYALAVAREHSFSRAADACNISQPSLSVSVKHLEEELDTPLFERFKNEIKVTEAGRAILEQAQRALEEVERIKLVAQSEHGALTGTLRLGAIYSVGPYLFPYLVPELHEAAPKLTLLVEENFTAVLADRLKRGEIDVAIVALPFDEPGIEVMDIYDEPFIAAVNSGHPWVGRDDLDGNELAGEKLLLLGKGHCFRDQVMEICEDCHHLEDTSQGMYNIIEANSLETIRHMVAVDTGISVMPVTSISSFVCKAVHCPEREAQTIRYVPFAEPIPFRTISLAWRASYPNPAIIEAMAEAIRRTPPEGVSLCE